MSAIASLPFPLPTLLAGAADEAPALPEGAALSDERLMERVARGDKDAFTLIYRRYERPVFGVLLRLSGQRALAEEWLQEAFTRVWLAAATHDASRGAVRPWIYAIAVNTARTEMSRKRHRSPHVSLEAAEMDLEDRTSGEAPLTARLDGQRRESALAEALGQLPAYLREVVVLRCSRELSFAEIEAVTGAPQGTLKSRFHRAVQALRERVDRQERRNR